MKILLRSTISQYSGYGRDGIGLALTLLDRGHDVRLSVEYLDAPVPREIANLLTLPCDPPFDLAIVHVGPEKVRMNVSDALAARCNVLWTMWGWPDLPVHDIPVEDKWVPLFGEETRLFDHIVVYDDHTAHAFAQYVPATERISTLLGGYTASDWQSEDDEPMKPRPYTFGMNGRLTVRKGVYTAYEAFRQLCEEHPDDFDGRLVLRSTEALFPPQFPLQEGVSVVGSRALPDELRHWYRSIDTLLCPSWAEGKHLPPIEALTCGTPVILSDILGHRGWATSEMATFVPTVLKASQPGYVGGYVSPEDLAAAMWTHYTDQEAQRRKAQIGARILPLMMDWNKCVERLGYKINLPL